METHSHLSAHLGASRAEVIKSRAELDAKGVDPEPQLARIMKDVRVLGMGETHIAPNPQRELGASAMADLKNAGATHLAIEMDQGRQAVLDKYMKTGELNPADLPEKLQTPDYVNMLESARARLV